MRGMRFFLRDMFDMEHEHMKVNVLL